MIEDNGTKPQNFVTKNAFNLLISGSCKAKASDLIMFTILTRETNN